jgi:glycosyltransferase involved in cell wall biosynthesis
LDVPANKTTLDRPLSILHLTAASDAGGLSRYVLDICGAMHERGHRVAVAGGRGAWHERFADRSWPWIDLAMKGGPMGLLRAARQLEEYLQGHPVDLIHTHYRRPTLVARRVQKKISIPILYTLHQPRISVRGPRKWLSDFGDWAHVPSQDAARWLVETVGYRADRICLVPHGIDPARFPRRDEAAKIAARKKLDLPAEALVAAFVGRLDVPKNEDWMIDVAEAVPGLIVLIAGDGPHAGRLRRRIGRFDGRVRMLGECETLPVYQAARR